MLAAHVAARTQRIRVGTAGIMLLNHPPFLVAEQINLLEALYPGRIDIGLGSSVGFTAPVRKALRQGDPLELKQQFENEVEALLGYLRGDGAMDTCIVIRSAFVHRGTAAVQAGAGVVHDSVPHSEADETLHKAYAVLHAIALAHNATLEVQR